MEIFFFWIILAFLVAWAASSKGRSGFLYFIGAVILSPVIAFIILLIEGENTENVEKQQINTGSSKKCPFCAELIKAEAVVCKHCGRDLPKEQPATERTESQPVYSRSEAPTPAGDRKRLMRHFGIEYDGDSDKYVFESYRYDRLEDAITYARKQSTK